MRKVFVPKAGMQLDRSVTATGDGEWRWLENARVVGVTTSSDGQVVPVNGHSSLVYDNVRPRANGTCVGTCEIDGGRSIIAFIDSPQGEYILHVTPSTQVARVLISATAFRSLEFSGARNVHADSVGSLVYYSAGKRSMRIDIDRALAASYPQIFSHEKPYDLLTLTTDDLSVARPQPQLAPIARYDPASEVGEYDAFTAGLVQFATRFVYADGERGLLSHHSNQLVSISDRTGAILIDPTPVNGRIPSDVTSIELYVRTGNSGTWSLAADEITPNPSGLFSEVLYDGSSRGRSASADADRSFENVPVTSLASTVAGSRLYLGNNVFGVPADGEGLLEITFPGLVEPDDNLEIWEVSYELYTGDPNDQVSQVEFIGYVRYYTRNPQGNANEPVSESLILVGSRVELGPLTTVAAIEQEIADNANVAVTSMFIDEFTYEERLAQYEDGTNADVDVSDVPAYRPGTNISFGLAFYDYAGRTAGVIPETVTTSIAPGSPEEIQRYAQKAFVSYSGVDIPEWADYAVICVNPDTGFREAIYPRVSSKGSYNADRDEPINTEINRFYLDEQMFVEISSSPAEILPGSLLDLGDGVTTVIDVVDGNRLLFEKTTEIRRRLGESIKNVVIRPAVVAFNPIPWRETHHVITKDSAATSGFEIYGDAWATRADVIDELLYEVRNRPVSFKEYGSSDRYGRSLPLADLELAVSHRPTSVIWSGSRVPGTSINGLSTFKVADERFVAEQGGAIQAMTTVLQKSVNASAILIIGEHDASEALVGVRTAQQGNQNIALTSGEAIGTITLLGRQWGTSHPESLGVGRGSAYYLSADSSRVVVYTPGKGLEDASVGIYTNIRNMYLEGRRCPGSYVKRDDEYSIVLPVPDRDTDSWTYGFDEYEFVFNARAGFWSHVARHSARELNDDFSFRSFGVPQEIVGTPDGAIRIYGGVAKIEDPAVASPRAYISVAFYDQEYSEIRVDSVEVDQAVNTDIGANAIRVFTETGNAFARGRVRGRSTIASVRRDMTDPNFADPLEREQFGRRLDGRFGVVMIEVNPFPPYLSRIASRIKRLSGHN